METEEDPRWVYRIDRDNGDMLSWGSMIDEVFTAHDVAVRTARIARAQHSYYTGPLKVYVWPERDSEHYRRDIPENAQLCMFGEGAPEMESE